MQISSFNAPPSSWELYELTVSNETCLGHLMKGPRRTYLICRNLWSTLNRSSSPRKPARQIQDCMIVSNFLSEGRSIGVLDFGDLAFLTPMLVRSITHTSAVSTILVWPGRGLNPGPPAYEANALPLGYRRGHIVVLWYSKTTANKLKVKYCMAWVYCSPYDTMPF